MFPILFRLINCTTFLFLFFLSSCSKNESSYFPLQNIKSWFYKIDIGPGVNDVETTGEINASYKRNYSSLNHTSLKFNGNQISTHPILRDDGTIFFYQISPSGIFRNATQFINSKEINFEKKKRTVLPFPLKIGQKWNVESKTFLIKRRYPWYDYGAITNFQLNYELISTSATLNTSLGKFKHCLLIQGKGKTTFIRENEVGTIEINILSQEWYAKGIGLVKSIRTEQTDTELFGTTRMVQSLVDYKIK